MSGPAPLAPADLALDPGVLDEGPVLEFGGFSAVSRHGGLAVLPWRSWALQAEAAGISWSPEAPASGAFPQALVRLSKGKAGVAADLWEAWRMVVPGGRLVLVGGNDLGIANAAKRLGEAIGQSPTVVANRARGRAVVVRREGLGPLPPRVGSSTLPGVDQPLTLLPGVFSADGLDEGTELLLAHLPEMDDPGLILDPGCGAGHLGLAGLGRWPLVRAWFGDGDHRAVRSTQANAAALGVADRATVTWWDAQEAIPVTGAGLTLLNPPAHAGTGVDTRAALGMVRAVHRASRPGGRLVLVANRHLPYEAELHRLGELTTLVQQGGFKILSIMFRAVV